MVSHDLHEDMFIIFALQGDGTLPGRKCLLQCLVRLSVPSLIIMIAVKAHGPPAELNDGK